MEQRTYTGNLDPDDLTNFLVSHFDPQENLQAQQIGRPGSHLVQIGRGDVPADLRYAVTVAIAPASGQPGITVTMGQQQWLNPKSAMFAATMGLISILITPFALFALLWPLNDAFHSMGLPDNIWNAVDTYVAEKGGGLGQTTQLQHPHVPGPAAPL